MITLSQFGNSVWCQKVRVTLLEKRLDRRTVEVNLFKNEQYDAYAKLNPAGVVPTLVHDGDVVIESTLICEYIDQLHLDPPLMPTRAAMRRWSKMADEGLHEGVGAISFSAMFRERMRAMTPEQREARYSNVGDPRRGDLFCLTYEHRAQARPVTCAVAAYDKMFARLETVLAEGRRWILGDRLPSPTSR